MRRTRLFSLALALVFAVGSFANGTSATRETTPLQVFAAASLSDAFDEIGHLL